MNLRIWIIVVIVLACLEGWAWRRDGARQKQLGNSSLTDTALLEPALLEKAHRIVILEKPQVKVVSREEGFEVRAIPEKDAPIRETILERRDGAHWVVANYFGLDVDKNWLGQTMSDLSQGRLVRFVASDPSLMSDLELDIGRVRFEDERGRVIRQLDFGRKDGSNTYQFVRIDEGDAFIAKHETEIVGDPTSWVVGRLLRFELGDVRELEMPFTDAGEKPLVLKRASAGAPLLPEDPTIPAEQAAQAVEKIVAKLLTESLMVAVDAKLPVVADAQKTVSAQLRIALFDGREYTIRYATLPASAARVAELEGYDEANAVFAFYTSTDPQDIVTRYQGKAGLIYNRSATLGRLPATRAALLAPPPPPPQDSP